MFLHWVSGRDGEGDDDKDGSATRVGKMPLTGWPPEFETEDERIDRLVAFLEADVARRLQDRADADTEAACTVVRDRDQH